MRPDVLSPLFAPVQSLTGVGPRIATLLTKLTGHAANADTSRVIDLLWHMPNAVIDRSAQPTLAEATPGTIATLKVRVAKHFPPPRGNRRVPYKVRCEDETGNIDLIFFHIERSFVERQLPVGETRFVSGRIEKYSDTLQMPHPDYMVTEEALKDLPKLEPVYPLTAGLSGKVLGKASRQAVARLVPLEEWQNEAWRSKQKWPAFHDALTSCHRPQVPGDISLAEPNRQRLAYDELLANQLALGLVRENYRVQRGRPIEGTGKVSKKIIHALPFSLTGSQQRAVKEIIDDMASDKRMLRLVQGDVGSGKTVVALLAIAPIIEAGAQAALMAPTEVLARQHYETIAPLADAAGLNIAVLTGREKGKPRATILDQVRAGAIDLLIGTHAIFQDDVEFQDLALAVIDEQHRFGVHQRLALQAKGKKGGAHVLVMTATPIPRTLLMTHYGDLDVSRLTEKPAGRKPVDTKATPIDRLEDVIDGLRRAVSAGAQVYWVCPLVETSEVSELAAAEERHAHLQQIFGEQVGLIHGAQSSKAKSATMAAFANGDMRILVATTVIEVGVNVPNATIMVIEHAERFGLAQLHQLRGRVGRGDRQSYCILLYKTPLTETAQARLQMMRDTEDGFLIAERDLELRGGGEVLGARQSGLPEFRVADVPNFKDLLSAARDDAKLILTQDPDLNGKRGQALRTLLYVFECDEAVRLFRAP
jgi:ATP-dependent DNA helicase RecG